MCDILHAGMLISLSKNKTLFFYFRHKLLTIPLTIRYLHYLLYNTSLEYNSYITFTVCLLFFFFNYTPMYLANYNAEQVST